MKTDVQCYHMQQAVVVLRRFVRYAAAFIKKETYIMCFCYLQDVEARVTVVTVYLLTVFMVFRPKHSTIEVVAPKEEFMVLHVLMPTIT
jgi:hypothetical protein